MASSKSEKPDLEMELSLEELELDMIVIISCSHICDVSYHMAKLKRLWWIVTWAAKYKL